MLSKHRLIAQLSALVKRAPAEGISVCAHARKRRVFRFAYQAIHQALVQESVHVSVKVIRNGRVGVASMASLEAKSLKRCVSAAIEIAEHSPKPDLLPNLPRTQRLHNCADFIEASTTMSAATCVTALKRLFHICQGAGATLAGSFMTGEDSFAVVNSAGVNCYAASTIVGAKLVTMYRKLSGYASGVHRDIHQLDLDALLKRSLSQSLHQKEPVTLPLGTYEVILEPEAVADLMDWLGYTAFGAKSVQERSSFLAGRMGEQVFAPTITISDDANDPATLRLPFDFEGVPKQKVVLIDRGKATGIVYDTAYGARFAHPSTGHGMPPDETEGPLPLHLTLAPGDSNLAQMLRRCRRGLLIPRFHYVNGLLNPREALMTGLTREGTFLVEDGRVVAPVTTMRFTQSLLEAFQHVLGISKERRVVADPGQDLGCVLAPALHLARFKFTGRSQR